MNNKTVLVAHREFLENVRTKTFWIGILFFPLIITASILVPMLLERTKGPRHYAVIDHSGWLLEEVEARASMPDLEKVVTTALDYRERQPKKFEKLPEVLQQVAEQLSVTVEGLLAQERGLEEEALAVRRQELTESVVSGFSQVLSGLDGPEGQQMLAMVPEGTRQSLLGVRDAIRVWWNDLPAEEAKDLGGVNKSRYVRVPVDPTEPNLMERLNAQIEREELFGYFVIGEDPISGSEGCQYVSNNLTDEDLKDWFSSLASGAVRERRLAQRDVDPEVASWIQSPIRFNALKVSRGGEQEQVVATDMVRQWAPVGFVYLLWMAVFSISQSLLTNTVEEKSNRILEVLLSSVSPLELMVGKIAGIAATGLTVVCTWVIAFLLAVKFVPSLIGGSSEIDFGLIARDPVFLASFIGYFLLGYLLYASLLVGIGAVCNSLKEAQNLMTPVTIMLMLPLFAMIPISKDPNGALAKVLSYIPPFTPFVMMNRAAGPPTPLEYALTTALLLASIGVAMWGAAKVFRIGVLLTGKTPTFPEIVKWIRTPVGQLPMRQRPGAPTP